MDIVTRLIMRDSRFTRVVTLWMAANASPRLRVSRAHIASSA